ncbi:MAG: Pyruvate formate-lyase 1-activating enzyme [Spirochaetes bacterium ADurb.Bin110]|nr:MAG: Pyruvate formate-lyase 1-activating enzyme [Spirochaetes bacterium ADurb.Bin110]
MNRMNKSQKIQKSHEIQKSNESQENQAPFNWTLPGGIYVSLQPSGERIRVGFRKTSLLDYPARLASVIFFTGCNFRCPWCHNRELVLSEADDLLLLGECLSIIEKRKHLVRGVVLTGGEPLLQEKIGELIAQIHELGLLVKLDTNGSLPEKLSALIEDPRTRPDYVALDLKTDAQRYGDLSSSFPFAAVIQSLNILAKYKEEFEVRSVVVPGYLDEPAVKALAALVPEETPWYFTAFAPGNCLDSRWNDVLPPDTDDIDALVRIAEDMGSKGLRR